jgi:hypothetical protein
MYFLYLMNFMKQLSVVSYQLPVSLANNGLKTLLEIGQLLEVFIMFDVLRSVSQHKPHMVAAMIAGRELFAIHASYFMFLCVIRVMHDAIDSRALNCVTVITYGRISHS